MKWYTEIEFPAVAEKIDYKSKVCFMGSCFAEDIGKWAGRMKFNSKQNLLGISYNPISIGKHMERSLAGEAFRAEELIDSHGKFAHLDLHSSFNYSDTGKFLSYANQILAEQQLVLQKADFLFLTFGSAIVFRHGSDGNIVNNCHRLPGSLFEKEMLETEYMVREMSRAIFKLTEVNPKIKIFMTVSPIRHLRHGAIANSRSKSRLISLCQKLEDVFEQCTYLPIYELVMDEMRDYRFYRPDDMIHLNEQGIEHIQEKIKACLISEKELSLMNRIDKWQRTLRHRIQDGQSEQAKDFIDSCLKETEALQEILPGRFDNELNGLLLLSQR